MVCGIFLQKSWIVEICKALCADKSLHRTVIPLPDELGHQTRHDTITDRSWELGVWELGVGPN